MGSQYELRIVQSSASLAAKEQVLYDSLAGSLKALDTYIPPVAYPKGALLFMEGQTASGIFAVCSGLVKLSTSSLEGRTVILEIAEPGDLIGLPAILSGKPYEVTAEISEPAQVAFIPRAAFLRFLHANPKAVNQVAQLLTDSHYAGHEVIQSLALSRSTSEKLARFFLAWSTRHARGRDCLLIAFTQAEIGEMIGVSRKTVTRLMTGLKGRNLLKVDGVTVKICNRAALESLAAT